MTQNPDQFKETKKMTSSNTQMSSAEYLFHQQAEYFNNGLMFAAETANGVPASMTKGVVRYLHQNLLGNLDKIPDAKISFNCIHGAETMYINSTHIAQSMLIYNKTGKCFTIDGAIWNKNTIANKKVFDACINLLDFYFCQRNIRCKVRTMNIRTK